MSSVWGELVRLSSEPRRARPVRHRAPQRDRAPTSTLKGLGRYQVRILAQLRRRPSTARQIAESLEHNYDSTCAALSAMLRSGLVADLGTTAGPTKQHARLYGAPIRP